MVLWEDIVAVRGADLFDSARLIFLSKGCHEMKTIFQVTQTEQECELLVNKILS